MLQRGRRILERPRMPRWGLRDLLVRHQQQKNRPGKILDVWIFKLLKSFFFFSPFIWNQSAIWNFKLVKCLCFLRIFTGETVVGLTLNKNFSQPHRPQKSSHLEPVLEPWAWLALVRGVLGEITFLIVSSRITFELFKMYFHYCHKNSMQKVLRQKNRKDHSILSQDAVGGNTENLKCQENGLNSRKNANIISWRSHSFSSELFWQDLVNPCVCQ